MRYVRILVSACRDFMKEVGGKSSLAHQSQHKVDSSLHWFALNYSLTAIAILGLSGKENRGGWGVRVWDEGGDTIKSCLLLPASGERWAQENIPIEVRPVCVVEKEMVYTF